MLISTEHKVQLRVMGMSSVLHVFSHKIKYWKNYYFELMMTLNVKGLTLELQISWGTWISLPNFNFTVFESGAKRFTFTGGTPLAKLISIGLTLFI